ncbi:MAG: uroporphyrinogen decarboxylase family protein [Chloroflexi bacterium]|nr:uroporphyrinogen decarboxylase family protein [Chloroflexota bacterium]
MQEGYTPLQRVLTTLGHAEPDRVPFFLLVTMHGAKELGLSIEDYFSRPETVVEGQLRMRAKYGHDCLYALFYASIEVEAWGGETIFRDDGPPNAGAPIIRKLEDIASLEPPNAKESFCLAKVLNAIQMLKERAGNDVPIIGVVMSPFSVPVMQIGFEGYIELMYERPDLFQHLMKVNEEFCVQWANAQLDAGATAIGYFDPVSSPSIVPRPVYLQTGFQIACRAIARIKGPIAVHFGSAQNLALVEDLVKTGVGITSTCVLDDLAQMKAACKGKIAVLGNLNGIEMRRWSPAQAEAAVKNAIAKGGPGGGFILSDGHGEIPWQVPDEVLLAMSQAVRRWGTYPLSWARDYLD